MTDKQLKADLLGRMIGVGLAGAVILICSDCCDKENGDVSQNAAPARTEQTYGAKNVTGKPTLAMDTIINSNTRQR